MSGSDYYPAGAYNDPYLNESDRYVEKCVRCGYEDYEENMYGTEPTEEECWELGIEEGEVITTCESCTPAEDVAAIRKKRADMKKKYGLK